MGTMATLIDNTAAKAPEPKAEAKPRHPEKQSRPETPLLRKPEWIRVKAPVSKGFNETRDIVRSKNLHTVCEEAACPNIGECWDKKHATMMIMGDTCTRACAFLQRQDGPALGARPGRAAPTWRKPWRRWDSTTSSSPPSTATIWTDGGAAHFAQVVRAIRGRCAPDHG